ncbi:hypothetical protein [Flavobacterium akiainvivens]|uniref:hypothetical protein n=1 Tax=Flavobacterium akiainvivens TaxID=1202724 RepID=UPI0006C8AAFF|nr:hypothetical protein [Flavobacterium akiainvivens]SFQ59924.1 hypothetical protein SAMN05444144_109144 [Flavobacterium akiainvivens]
MPQYIDQYHLVYSRRYNTAIVFLDRFMPNREQESDAFSLPQYADVAEREFSNEHELMKALETDTASDYCLYWRNSDPESPIHHTMVLYTTDGATIFGFSTPGSDPETDADALLYYNECKKLLNPAMGCMTVEERAPDSVSEFIDFCNNRFVPEL